MLYLCITIINQIITKTHMETKKTINEILKRADELLLEHLNAGNYRVEEVGEYAMTLKVGSEKIRFWCSQQGVNYYSVYDDDICFPISKETKVKISEIYKKALYGVFEIEQEIKRLEEERKMLVSKLNKLKQTDAILQR